MNRNELIDESLPSCIFEVIDEGSVIMGGGHPVAVYEYFCSTLLDT